MGLTYDQLFPGRFIKAGEMHDEPVTLTIADIALDTMEQEDGTEKQQPVVGFVEIKRQFALNKTNAQCLRAMWGDDTGDWIGHKVTLFPERDASGLSDSGLCIRVKGSPDISKPVQATIKLPRRRPQTRTMVPTKASAGEEVADFDPDAETANGHITPDQVEALLATVRAKGREPEAILKSLHSSKVCEGGFETIPQAKFAHVMTTLAGLSVAEKAAEAPDEAEAAPTPAEDATAADEAPAPEDGADTEPLSADDAKFLAETAAEKKDDAPKVTRSQQGIIGGLLEKSRVPESEWRGYMEELTGKTSRRELTRDEAEQLIKFLRGTPETLAV